MRMAGGMLLQQPLSRCVKASGDTAGSYGCQIMMV